MGSYSLLRSFNQLGWKCRMVPNIYNTSQRFLSSNRTHYEILEVSKDATDEEIKAAYKRLSKKYHPDTAKENNTHEKFIEVNEAFQTLSKPISRRDYDLKLKYGTEQFEYKTQEEAKEKQPSWREKPYWERTKEEDKEFREWYYKEFGMGSPHSPNVPDPFWFLTGKQAILLAVTLGFCLQYARWRWLKTRTELIDSQHSNRMQKMEKENQDKLEWIQRERENFANIVDKELERNNDTNLQTLLHKKEGVSVLSRNEGVAIPNVTPA